MAVRTKCPCMAAPKQIKGGAVNDTGYSCSLQSGHLDVGKGNPGKVFP